VPMQIVDRFGFTHLQERCWTGIQYDAIIVSVNRRKELVYLQAEGLAPLSMGNVSSLTVNATIPMKHSSLEAQRMSLVRISVELEKVWSLSFTKSFRVSAIFRTLRMLLRLAHMLLAVTKAFAVIGASNSR
jgi:hypothetical protein